MTTTARIHHPFMTESHHVRMRCCHLSAAVPLLPAYGGMAAASSGLPAAKSANPPSTRRQMTEFRAVFACSRRQSRRLFRQSRHSRQT